MHELSICRCIVDSIIQEMGNLEKKPARLVSARIVAGELRQIVPSFLEDAYGFMTKDTDLDGSVLEIESVPKQCVCRQCSWSGPLHIDEYECRNCHSCDLKVDGGQELYLENLEVEY